MLNKFSYLLISFLLPFSFLDAEEIDPKKNEKERKEQTTDKLLNPDIKEEFSETLHEVVINGQRISYKAIAGHLILKDDKGSSKASVFFIAYTKQETKDYKQRPITFCFNGGPGSSSVWLHLGVFGPKRVYLSEKGDALPPYRLVDNEFSILDQTDLVFIDPISTGYSRAIPGEEAKKYHGVEEDIKSIAEFIRLYVTRYERWDSPKFLAGESYGTTRAAGLAGHLHDQYFMTVNGLILVSSVLNFQSILFDAGNDLSYLMFLPSYTATAWYHGRLPQDLQRAGLKEVVEESKDFVINEYSLALFKGNLLKPQEKDYIAGQLARYTGLSSKYIADSDLRVDMMHFAKELLRDQRRTVGRFDSRFQGIDASLIGEQLEYDPSVEALFGAFTANFNQYVRTDLKWETNLDYKILANISSQWDYGIAKNQYLNVTDTLRSVMTRNPYIRVFVANGYYDLATPLFGTEYTFNHLNLDPAFKDHVLMKYYEAGHMMYIHRPSLVKMKSDLTEYYIHTLEMQEEETNPQESVLSK